MSSTAKLIDWNGPLEAVLEDGTTVPVELEVALDDGDYAIVYNPSVEFECYTPDGRAWIEPDHPIYIRNVVVSA